MKTYQIHLIRNGLTKANLEGKYIGHKDVPLSSEGIKQLHDMKGKYTYPRVDAVFTSPLQRCTKTAQIIYPDNSPLVFEKLIEYNFGDFEDKTAEELQGDELFVKWLAGDPEGIPPFGETNSEFAERVLECFRMIVEGVFKAGVRDCAIITHGGVIMTILSAFGLPERPMHEWLIPNGCGYTMRLTPSLWMRLEKAEIISEIPCNVIDDDEYNPDKDVNYLDIDDEYFRYDL
ncbi:MAG: histidine phosphatase family protein [Clostridiales bacterium]|nr:histidine phosphatase family protein [Clostridiales bacterium]